MAKRLAKSKYNLKMFLIILFPLIVSMVTNSIIAIAINYEKPKFSTVADFIMNAWKYICIIYWYWVGKKYGQFNRGGVKSFVLGNILWGIGLIFYIIIFFATDSNNRLNLIKVIPLLNQLAQGYPLGFIFWSSHMISIFTKNINGSIAVVISYGLMILVFSIGFYNGRK